jgi:hypothetical protein
MKFDGVNWVYVGLPGFSEGMAEYSRIAFSQSGQPYVAYQDFGNSGKATVMKYDSVFVGINELQEPGLSVYPNPATDNITIETSGTSKEICLEIVTIGGQELIKRQIAGLKTQIDVSNLPRGVYFVRITNDMTLKVGMFVKQ